MGDNPTNGIEGAGRAHPLELARAGAVMSGGPVVLLLVALASVVVTVAAVVDGELPPWPALVGLMGIAAYRIGLVPWTRSWGATTAERRAMLPGDELVERAGVTMTRAITVDAPIEAVWPWLAQIGQDRAGFYSYRWLENLAGCRMPEAHEVHPEWQDRRVGEMVMFHPRTGARLARFDRNRSYAFEGGWYLTLVATAEGRARLIARSRIPRGPASILYALLIELPHFIMERKMLRNIAQLAATAPTHAYASTTTTPAD
ncbi:MAG TPA: hypothetical protein VLV15_16650 [Dongiaceae bacterium]|nr:hypothetical protein [Dongiaceae bacterium]